MHNTPPPDSDRHPRLADGLRIETIVGTAEDPHGPLSLVLNPQAPSWAQTAWRAWRLLPSGRSTFLLVPT